MKINNWKCDICGKVFDTSDYGYNDNLSMKIEIPSTWANQEEIFTFNDTCSECRGKISLFLKKLVDPL